MKYPFLIFFLLCFTLRGATLSWDASATPGVSNYFVYWGDGSATNSYTNRVSTGTNLSLSLTNWPTGFFGFAVTAQDASGLESAFSESVTWTNRPAPPGKPRISVILQIESKETLDGEWGAPVEIVHLLVPSDRERYFRSKLSVVRIEE